MYSQIHPPRCLGNLVAILAISVLLPRLSSAQELENLIATADSLAQKGNPAAYELFIHCLNLAETRDGTEGLAVAKTLYGVGNCLFDRADYPAADSVFSRALAIYKKHKDSNTLGAALCLLRLASVYKKLSKFNQAEQLIRQAIAIRETFYGKENSQVANALNNLANLFLEREANYAEIESLYKRALRIMKSELGESAPGYAAALNNLAVFYHRQGRYDEAKSRYKKALDINREQAQPQQSKIAQILKNSAEIEHDEGHYDVAEALYREALNLTISARGNTHTDVAETQSEFARLLKDRNRPDEAEPLALQAVKIGEEMLPDSSTSLAEFRKNLGDVYQLQQRFSEAQALYEKALAVETAPGNENRTYAAKILNSQAVLAATQGNLTAAAALEKKAYLIRRKNFDKNFSGLTEKAALDNSQFLQNEAANYLSILLDAPEGETANRDEIAKVVFSTKGLVTDGIFVRAQFNTTIAALNDSAVSAKNNLARIIVNPNSTEPELADAEERVSYFETELARVSAQFRDEKIITQVEAAKVAAALPQGSALVEYVRYRHQASLINFEQRYLAVLVKSNGKVFAFDLGAAAAIDSAVAAYRRHMAAFRNLNLDEYYERSYDLYKLLWQPLENQVVGLNSVLICPDGALSLVSFAGLWTSEAKYLIENYPIHYISSGRDLTRDPLSAASGNGLLAIGDPDYGSPPPTANDESAEPAPSCRSAKDILRKHFVERLPATRNEVQEIVNRWKQAMRGTVTEFYAAAATEEAFKKNAHGQRVIHLATHGFSVVGDCLPGQGENRFIGDNPLLYSGLFFANSNLKGIGLAADQEDGTLTAQEVGSLNLSGTELVVLSACETGQGEVRAGEGVIGLRRAFEMAGAKTVISALWAVDDQSTAELMSTLFANTETNLPRAMQQAAISILAAKRAAAQSDHPWYWAAFIATGDWNTSH
jgi:CHAT domain-containing protein